MSSADKSPAKKRFRYQASASSNPVYDDGSVDSRYSHLWCQPTASHKTDKRIGAVVSTQRAAIPRARWPLLSAYDDGDLPEVGIQTFKALASKPSNSTGKSGNPQLMGWLPKEQSSPPKTRNKRDALADITASAARAAGEVFDIPSSPEKPVLQQPLSVKSRTDGASLPIAVSALPVLDLDDDVSDPTRYAAHVARTLFPESTLDFVNVNSAAEGADHNYVLSSPPEVQTEPVQHRVIGWELQPDTRPRAAHTQLVDLSSDSDDPLQLYTSSSASRPARSHAKQPAKAADGSQYSGRSSFSQSMENGHERQSSKPSSRRSISPNKGSPRGKGKARDISKPTQLVGSQGEIYQFTSASPRRRGPLDLNTIDSRSIQRDKDGHAVSAVTKIHHAELGESDSDTVCVAPSIALGRLSPRTDATSSEASRHLSSQPYRRRSITAATGSTYGESSNTSKRKAKSIACDLAVARADSNKRPYTRTSSQRNPSSARSGTVSYLAISRPARAGNPATSRPQAKSAARSTRTTTAAATSAEDMASDLTDARALASHHRSASSDGDMTILPSAQVILDNLKPTSTSRTRAGSSNVGDGKHESSLGGFDDGGEGSRCAFCDGLLPAKPSQNFLRMYSKLCRKPEVRPRPFSRNPHAIQLPSVQTAAACKRHREEREIIPAGLLKGYPAVGQIAWKGLPSRLSRLQAELMKIVRGDQNSSLLQAARGVWVQKGARKMANVISEWSSFDDEIPGYYGPRGSEAITEWLNKNLVNEHIITEHDAAPLDMASYVRRVLVPEMAILLITEDRGPNCGRNKAVRILKASRSYGAAVFPWAGSDINADVSADTADALEEDKRRAEAIAANGQRAEALRRGEAALSELLASHNRLKEATIIQQPG